MQLLTVQSEPTGDVCCPVTQELKNSHTTLFWGWTTYSPLPTPFHKKYLWQLLESHTHTQAHTHTHNTVTYNEP